MKLISESCCGRQRVSLKLELWSTQQGLLYRRIRVIVNKAGIFRFSFTHLPHATLHGRWITLSSLTYDLHLIVSKFKAIR